MLNAQKISLVGFYINQFCQVTMVKTAATTFLWNKWAIMIFRPSFQFLNSTLIKLLWQFLCKMRNESLSFKSNRCTCCLNEIKAVIWDSKAMGTKHLHKKAVFSRSFILKCKTLFSYLDLNWNGLKIARHRMFSLNLEFNC